MRNLAYLVCTEINEYDYVVFGKRNPTKATLQGLRARINTEYGNYLSNFGTIHTKPPNGFNDDESSALRSCYNVKTIARDRLVARIISLQTTTFQSVCAYCLYFPRVTIDHYIPKEEYPSFSIMAKNMLPCCSTCNGIKNDIWRNGTGRLFLHFYNDIIPNAQFLYGALSFNASGLPIIRYTLQNLTHIQLQFFQLISHHFSRLQLLELYSNQGTSQLLSEIRIDMATNRSTYGPISDPTIQAILSNKAQAYRNDYGLNYWKAIALDILSNSARFRASI